ncbi:MAG: photosystem II assembly protein, partial [Cyanobacteriota bacterium]|nr:photosystem II assembly protein [Cyanobacteriota bacterium]
MRRFLKNWSRSRRFRNALLRGNLDLAEEILAEMEHSRQPLSLLEVVFRKKLHADQDIKSRHHENIGLRSKIQQQIRKIEDLERELKRQSLDIPRLAVNPDFLEFVTHCFQFKKLDESKLQCTGIDEQTFEDFEHRLAVFLQKELKKQNSERVKEELQTAFQELEESTGLGEPSYNSKLSSYAYLMRDFLENVYCNYIAWFLIYQAGLIPEQLRILDIAAGPGTTAYALRLLLCSSIDFSPLPDLQVSYYSLEKQALFQFRGLQFWRQYIEPQHPAINIYFRFDTTDLFDYEHQEKKIPQAFFNFIVISHGFFTRTPDRLNSYTIYKQIFRAKLAPGGFVLLIVRGVKLFKMYEVYPT